MQLSGFPQNKLLDPCTLTIGVFDGMHTGHATFLKRMAAEAHGRGQVATVVTFDPHPDLLIHPDRYTGLLITPNERYARIAECGIDIVITLQFDAVIRAMSAADFMNALCASVALRTVWVGWDFALGRGRDGTFERLVELGIELGYTAVEVPQIGEAHPPSASLIRDALSQGDITAATIALGRPFGYTGVVVHGDKRGRTIGFPTANIQIDERLILPKYGVYATFVTIASTVYPSVTNIGVRPTFDGIQPRIEAHLLDVDVDVYDETAHIELIAHLRGEQKFAGLDALKTQIARDAHAARAILSQAH